MGKIRIQTIGDEEQEKLLEEERKKKKEAKKAKKEAQEKTEESQDTQDETQIEQVAEESVQQEAKAEESEPKKEKKAKKEKFQKAPHSTKYTDLATKLDSQKVYSIQEGLELLKTLQRGTMDETVELHINTIQLGISGNVVLPHGTGKKTRVAIASDALLAEVEKGKIDFDILVATPDMMPKLARVARVLGPRGLMPNPKNGTITTKPEEVVKNYEGGQVNFKTEAKNPILHLTVGKMSFGTEKLAQNADALIAAVKKSNIVDVTLKSTMSPGIKVKV